MMEDNCIETRLPSLKNTEYTRRLDCSLAPLLRQIIQGAEEIELAGIGPAISSGPLILDSSAAFFSSGVEVEMKGAESVFCGISSMIDEQAASARQGSTASDLIRSSISKDGHCLLI
jgi:hypothetical protein